MPLDPFVLSKIRLACCPFHGKFALRGHTILQIQIDEALVWDALFFSHILEIVYDIRSNAQCDLLL